MDKKLILRKTMSIVLEKYNTHRINHAQKNNYIKTVLCFVPTNLL